MQSSDLKMMMANADVQINFEWCWSSQNRKVKRTTKEKKWRKYMYSQYSPCKHSHNDHRSDIKMFKTVKTLTCSLWFHLSFEHFEVLIKVVRLWKIADLWIRQNIKILYYMAKIHVVCSLIGCFFVMTRYYSHVILGINSYVCQGIYNLCLTWW